MNSSKKRIPPKESSSNKRFIQMGIHLKWDTFKETLIHESARENWLNDVLIGGKNVLFWDECKQHLKKNVWLPLSGTACQTQQQNTIQNTIENNEYPIQSNDEWLLVSSMFFIDSSKKKFNRISSSAHTHGCTLKLNDYKTSSHLCTCLAPQMEGINFFRTSLMTHHSIAAAWTDVRVI